MNPMMGQYGLVGHLQLIKQPDDTEIPAVTRSRSHCTEFPMSSRWQFVMHESWTILGIATRHGIYNVHTHQYVCWSWYDLRDYDLSCTETNIPRLSRRVWSMFVIGWLSVPADPSESSPIAWTETRADFAYRSTSSLKPEGQMSLPACRITTGRSESLPAENASATCPV